MGEVYLCLDLESMHPYALKTMQVRYHSENYRHLFEREALAWMQLEKHPNIVRCHYMDIIDHTPYLFLDWIYGDEQRPTDLRGWLRHNLLDKKSACNFVIDICRGLIHAQEKRPGIVHCDLKPENVLIQNSRAMITDWGLVNIVRDEPLPTEGESHRRGIAGTPLYMAPEQWQGSALDQRTDIYAVGCIFYELLTGKPPFVGATVDQLRVLHLTAQAPIVQQADGGDALTQVVQRCLAKNSNERYADAKLLLGELEAAYEQEFLKKPKPLPDTEQLTAQDYYVRASS
jgi:serine/threonine-protein kinase